jgi:hypothetical protein
MTSTKEIALKNMYRTNVEILLNRQTDDQGRSIAMMDGYSNGDKLEVVASYDACNYPSDTEILNEAFKGIGFTVQLLSPFTGVASDLSV